MRFGFCSSCCPLFKLIVSLVGTLSGLSIFIVFLYEYNNYNAAIWGFVSGVFAFCVFQLNYLYIKNKIDEWYDHKSLENFKILGLIGALTSVVSIGVYVSLVLTRNQDIYDMKDFSYFPAAIFSVLSLKWGLMLFINAGIFEKYVLLCNPQFVYSVTDS